MLKIYEKFFWGIKREYWVGMGQYEVNKIRAQRKLLIFVKWD